MPSFHEALEASDHFRGLLLRAPRFFHCYLRSSFETAFNPFSRVLIFQSCVLQMGCPSLRDSLQATNPTPVWPCHASPWLSLQAFHDVRRFRHTFFSAGDVRTDVCNPPICFSKTSHSWDAITYRPKSIRTRHRSVRVPKNVHQPARRDGRLLGEPNNLFTS